MAKLTAEQIGIVPPGGGTPGGIGTAGGSDDFLGRLNTTVNNLKQLFQMAQSAQGLMKPALSRDNDPLPQRVIVERPAALPPARPSRLPEILGMIEAAVGIMTVGEVLDKSKDIPVSKIIEEIRKWSK